MCFRWIKNLFSGGGEDSSTQKALDAARLAAQTAATDEESVRQAQEARLKRLYAQRGQSKSFQGADLAKAPTAVRMLLGQ